MAQLIFKMTLLHFSDTPAVRHQVQVRSGAIQVDGTDYFVRTASPGCFVTTLGGRTERLYAIAHGDGIFVQHKGRAWKIDHVDPTRSAAAAAPSGAGASHAPMPGVVVSILTRRGQHVRQGEALLVIESMKLQMTISASIAGEIAELPLAVGQTFQRSDMLVRVQALGESA